VELKKGNFLLKILKKSISTNDSLQRLGIKPPVPPAYNLSFKIPTKTTSVVHPQTSTQPRPIKPHKTGSFDQLKVDLRVFLDEGDLVLVNLRGQGRDWKGDIEFNVKSVEFNRFTIDDLISKTGKRWPILEPEGWLQTTEKTISFNGSDKLTAIGIIPNSEYTNSYSLVFPVSDEKHPTDTSTVSKTVVKNPTPAPPQGTNPNRGISEGSLGVNVRLFYDEPYYNIQFTGVAGDIRVEADLSLKKSEYENLTFGELKRKLRRWPETASTGKFHTQTGNISYSDSDKPHALGMVATADGKPTIYQFSWDLK